MVVLEKKLKVYFIMNKAENIYGIKRVILLLKIKLYVFFYFLPYLLGGKITFERFVIFIKRLLYFISKIGHNKFVKIGRNTRLNLYVPGFPSEAFYTACKKFMAFDLKLPCATALISVTSACRFNCAHCYQKYDNGTDIDIEILVTVVKKLQDNGVAFFNIEGGEPFLVYERLKRICGTIDGKSEIWINSTGDGITIERLKELKKLNVTAIMFSLHSPIKEDFNKFMGRDEAWDILTDVVEKCHKAGIAVTFNCCVEKNGFYNGIFDALMEKAKEFNAALIQLIKPKPAGGWLSGGFEGFDEKDMEKLKEVVNKYNFDPKYREYPAIYAQAIEEDKNMFGCTAGGTDRFYINAKGDLQPCEFLNISFGNIATDNFDEIYKKMRDTFENPGECMLCEKYSNEILKIYNEKKLKSLPLSQDLSKCIYDKWDRGEETELYKKLWEIK